MKTNELHASNYWVFFRLKYFFFQFLFEFNFQYFSIKSKSKRAIKMFLMLFTTPYIVFINLYIQKYTRFYIFGAPSHLFDMLLCTHTLVILYPVEEQHVFRTQVFRFSWNMRFFASTHRIFQNTSFFFCLTVSFCNISYSKSTENRTPKRKSIIVFYIYLYIVYFHNHVFCTKKDTHTHFKIKRTFLAILHKYNIQ